MNKKKLWVVALLILAAAGAITFLLWPKTDLAEKVELAEIRIVDGMPLFLAFVLHSEKDFFEKEGLRVKWSKTVPEEGLSALLTGEVDYAVYNEELASPFIEAALGGAPIKVIMLTKGRPAYSFVAQAELETKELKTIAIGSINSIQHYFLLKFIEENYFESEVKIIIPTAEDFSSELYYPGAVLRNWLSAGKIDAILYYPLAAIISSHLRGFKILETIPYEAPSILVVREDKIEKTPEEIEKVIRALQKIREFIVTNPEGTKEIIPKTILMEFELNEQELTSLTELIYPIFKTDWDRTSVPYDEGAELLIQLVKAGEFETVQEVEEQVITQEELDKVFDFRFVK